MRMMNILIYNLDDLEYVDLKHLHVAQDDMVKKLSLMDEQDLNVDDDEQSKQHKKTDGMSKRFGLKGWGWKQSPIKSSSIEEEQQSTSCILLESPKRSLSSKSTSPNQSPKHRVSSAETIRNCGSEEITSVRRRKLQKKHDKQKSSELSKSELRASASARLIQLFDSKDGIDKLTSEFNSLLPENERPASIHNCFENNLN